MISAPATSAPRELGGTQLLDELTTLARSPRAASALEGLVAFCALLVLRHADELEAEDEAVAVFDGTPFQRSLTVGVRWRELCRMEEAQLRVALRTLPAFLSDSEDRGGGALARRVTPALTSTHLDDRVAAFAVVRDLSLASIFDRHAVLDALDAVLGRQSEGKGEALDTPLVLARWMVDQVEAAPTARVYDPCFGIGALLAEVVRRRALARLDHPVSTREPETTSIFGVERSPTAFVIGLARVILAGEDRPALELGDTLEREMPASLRRDGFDLVLAHPPFGARIAATSAGRHEFKTLALEGLFLQHVMACLRPRGRAVLLLPRGILFQGGAVAELRRALLNRLSVEAIHLLPGGLLLPATAIETALLCLERTLPSETISVIELKHGIGRGAAAQEELAFGGGAPRTTTRLRSEVLASPGCLLIAEEVDHLREQLVRLGEDIAVVPLRDLCSVRRGTATSAKGREPVVLSANIADGRIMLNSRFGAESETRDVAIRTELPLRAGDIVLSIVGGSVRAGLVANGAVGAVAHREVLVVRLHESVRPALSPQFLLRYLCDPVVEVALLARTRGTASRWVRPGDFAALPVPVPPLPLQERAARDRSVPTLLEALGAVMSRGPVPLEAWVERSAAVAALKEGLHRGDALDHIARLVALAAELQAEFGVSLPSENTSDELVEHLTVIMPFLEDVARAQQGVERLAVLQAGRLAWERLRWMPFKVRVVDRTDDLLLNLGQTMKIAVERIARDHRIELVRYIVLKREDDASECSLTFVNAGSIGVCALTLRGAGFTYGGSSLGPGEAATFSVRIAHPRDAAEVEVVVDMSCRQFDGEVYTGRLVVKLDLQLSSPSPDRPLDASPYITGASLTRSEMVYGRDPIFEDLSRLLASPNAAPLVLLEGNKRVGKTSIMNQLLASRAPAGYVVSYATLQGAAGRSEGGGLTDREIWHHVAYSIADAIVAAGLFVPPPEVTLDEKPTAFARKLALRRALSSFITADHPYEAFVTWIELVLEALGERRLLVMIDEFDKLQEGVEAGVTSPQLVENLRAMYLQRPRLGFVIAGGRRLARLRTEYFSALFGVGHRITVGPLPEDAARALVTEPVRGQLLWLPGARDEVVRRCARHPFLIQAVCNQVFLRAARENERRIGVAFVEKALDEAVDGMDHFPTLWKQVGTPRRQLLLALCAMDAESGAARDIGVLEEQLTSRGVSVPAEGIDADLAALDELELIGLETEGGYQRYRLRLPIFAAWVQRRVDLGALAREASLQTDLEET
ncbi:MAG: N-6 DNA methylase [Polyangiales bacterium]